ncbi:acyltransferase [Arthrobacter psychrolactophilus]|uniref:Acyltransferase n=1 Tax=Arthrobacter psychrolactophilus TaxID=92442 RepID=A0A2V5JI37_9MICC|nr:acyltransferase family protein [Arthrobacter psychrolactophilus]PYI39807.1 acyltransferase [Arthrobacter psychrolactophilus]
MTLVAEEKPSVWYRLSGRSSFQTSLPRRKEQRKFLPEVQGLRAIAVLMVVSYHVWFGRISGGVDVFLLISAFLLTGQFVRKLENGRALELLKYWGHLFKRLLPMIAVTLLGVLLASYLFMPETNWTGILRETWSSLLYYQNWFLASEAVDYYATDHSVASPLQHFWSLSIQGQIFILWPVVFAVAGGVARKFRLRIRPLLIYIFGAIFVVSLAFSIVTTNSQQAFAYFDTRTRLWEFALGSLLALVLPYLDVKRSIRMAMGWVGIVAMLSCGLILQVGQKFPGHMALWPTLAAALIIIAGFTNSSMGVDRFLSWKPLVKLGDSSYALYLMHWPVLVFFLIVSGRENAGLIGGTAIILVSLAAAILATRFIDTPLRRNQWIEKKSRRSLLTIAICIALVATPLGVWQLHIHRQEAAVQAKEQANQAEVLRNYPGALSLHEGFVDEADPDLPLKPALTALNKQWVSLGTACEGAFLPDSSVLQKACGQTKASSNASKTIVILGDSHAEQFSGALIPVAKNNDWQLVSLLLGGCDFGSEESNSGRGADCQEFNKAAMSYVLQLKPDAVFTVATDAIANSSEERLVPGYEDTVKSLVQAGIEVIGLRDNPRFTENKASCVARLGAVGCEFQQSDNLASSNPAEPLNQIKGAHMIDLTDQYCLEGTCKAVAGNILVYLDDNHLTWDYTRTMSSALGERIATATTWKMK